MVSLSAFWRPGSRRFRPAFRIGLEGTSGVTTALLLFNSQPLFFGNLACQQVHPEISSSISPASVTFPFYFLFQPRKVQKTRKAAEEQQEAEDEVAT